MLRTAAHGCARWTSSRSSQHPHVSDTKNELRQSGALCLPRRMIAMKAEPGSNQQQLAASVQEALESLATDADKSPEQQDSHLQAATPLTSPLSPDPPARFAACPFSAPAAAAAALMEKPSQLNRLAGPSAVFAHICAAAC